jgi:hypothetical protein
MGTSPYLKREIVMNKLAIAIAGLIFSTGAFAQGSTASSTSKAAAAPAASSSCEAKAVDKNGKPLAGAAKTSFMKKCEGETTSNKASTCEDKAIDKNGKPLAGAAKTSFMKKCGAESPK